MSGSILKDLKASIAVKVQFFRKTLTGQNLQKVFTEKAINLEAKQNAKNIDLDIRVECLAKTNSLHKFKRTQTKFYVQSSVLFIQPM